MFNVRCPFACAIQNNITAYTHWQCTRLRWFFFLMHMPERMFIGVDAIHHCAIHSQICPRYVLYGSGLIWATSLPQSSAEKNADLLDHRNHSKWFVQNLPVQSLFLMLIQIYYDAVCWIFSPPSCGVAFNRSANIVPTEAMIIKSLSKCK